MKQSIVACLAAFGLGLFGTFPVDEAIDLPACQTEDDPGPCHWDAATQGNGCGHSFVVVDETYTYGSWTPCPWDRQPSIDRSEPAGRGGS